MMSSLAQRSLQTAANSSHTDMVSSPNASDRSRLSYWRACASKTRRLTALLLAALLWCGLWPPQAIAAPGDLDLSFGLAGKRTTDFSGGEDTLTNMVLQPDGKFVTAGYTCGASCDFALARYHDNGTLDASFGSGGKVTTDFSGGVDAAYDITLLADGKMIAVGVAHSGSSYDFALARYHSDGTLDTSFGTNGKTLTNFFGNTDSAGALAVLPDGKIVVVGWGRHVDPDYTGFALARYHSDGTLDTSFGTEGKTLTRFLTNDAAFELSIQSDGKIVAAGYDYSRTTPYYFALARYHSDGSLDTSFGSGGSVITDFPGADDAAYAMTVQPDGKFVVVGTTGGTSPVLAFDFALARYNNDGSLDTSFGNGGKVTTNFSPDDIAHAVAIQPDGKILAAGYQSDGSPTFLNFVLARYNSDGSPDTGFGSGGKVTTEFFGGSDIADAILIQPDGKIVVGGESHNVINLTSYDFALARYNGDGGATTSGLQYYPLPNPIRLLDTRPGQPACDTPGTPLIGAATRTEPARTACSGIPSSAQVVVGNATVVNNAGTGDGYITLYPSGAAQPTVSNLNYVAGQVVPNAFTVGLGSGDGAFNIFASSPTHFIVDITGYYAPPAPAGLYYHPLPNPVRLLDSRPGQPACDAPGTPLAGGASRTQPARVSCSGVTIPNTAQVIVGNATVVNHVTGAGGGYITLYPSGASQPTVSNLNYVPDQVVPNAFTVGLGGDGAFNIFASSPTHFIVDITGYYSTQVTDVNGVGLHFNSLSAPVRLLDTRPGQPACDTPGTPLIGAATRTEPARTACSGIPSTAQVVVGNATVVNNAGTGDGYITLYPSGAAQPTVSNLNYVAGQVVPNAFTVGLGSGDGAFNIFASSPTHFIVDLAGYFAPPGASGL